MRLRILNYEKPLNEGTQLLRRFLHEDPGVVGLFHAKHRCHKLSSVQAREPKTPADHARVFDLSIGNTDTVGRQPFNPVLGNLWFCSNSSRNGCPKWRGLFVVALEHKNSRPAHAAAFPYELIHSS